MEFKKIALLGAALTLFRMVCTFFVTKVIAIYTGPLGVAYISQLQSFIAGITGLAANQIGQGLVRFTAENKGNGYGACQPWWSAAVWLMLPLMLTSSVLICLFSSNISEWLFGTDNWNWIIIITGLSLPFCTVNPILTSTLNGLGENKKLIKIGILSVSATTFITLLMTYLLGVVGGILSIALSGVMTGLIAFLVCNKIGLTRPNYWFSKSTSYCKKHMSGYMLMGLIGAATGPVALITVRNIISTSISPEATGIWQSVARISDAFISICTVGIGMYYFPKAAAIKEAYKLKIETIKILTIILPVLLLGSILIYLMRFTIIDILYTKSFASGEKLFVPELIADIFKILSFIPGSILLAKGYFKLNAFAEISVNILFVLGVKIFVGFFGLIGVNYSYLCATLFYLVFTTIFFFYHCRKLEV